MTDEHFRKLKGMVGSRKCKLRAIIAPPRTASTLLESSLSMSPDVGAFIHEPFIDIGRHGADSDSAYRAIYNGICDSRSGPGSRKKTFIVKEMSHWLDAEAGYKDFFDFIDDPVVFVIRNPFLAMESRIKKYIQGIPMKARLTTQQWLLDYYARSDGFSSWRQSCVKKSKKMPAVDSGGDLNRLLAAIRLAPASMYESPNLLLQQHLLDFYAKTIGFLDWNNFVTFCFLKRSYSLFADILQIDRKRFDINLPSWEALERQFQYLLRKGRSPVVLDSGDLCLNPEKALKGIARSWRISYVKKMADWGMHTLCLGRGQHRDHDLIWYDSLAQSGKVEPPASPPPQLSHLPAFAIARILKVDFPAYFRLSQSKGRLRGDQDIIGKKMNIAISAENRRRFMDLGIVEGALGSIISVAPKDVDPIFSVVQQPQLLGDSEFMKRWAEYARVFEVMRQEEGAGNLI